MPTRTSTTPDIAPPPGVDPATAPATRNAPWRSRLVAAGWMGHWLLRIGLAGIIAVYGWSKVFLLQMGRADVGDALVQFGEMSPMGLLWRLMGFSPLVQCLAGLAEVLAAVLLVWRRTAGLGALIGAADMGVVFVLNLAYDVPVKQLSLALTVGCLLVLAPYAARFARALLGSGPVPAGPSAEAVPFPRVRRFTRFAGPLAGLALVALAGAGVVGTVTTPEPMGHGVPGVYRVTQDAARPSAQLSRDARWSQVSFARDGFQGRATVSIRLADGRLYLGGYRIPKPGTIEITRGAPLHRDEPSSAKSATAQTLTLSFTRAGDGLHLVGAGQDLVLTPDPEATFLHDRGFSWDPRPPLNR